MVGLPAIPCGRSCRLCLVLPSFLSRLQNTMSLIRTILDRLSDSLFVAVPGKMRAPADLSNQPSLRLVSDKSSALPAADASVRRTAGQVGSQLDAIDDAVRRSQAWFLSRQHATEG